MKHKGMTSSPYRILLMVERREQHPRTLELLSREPRASISAGFLLGSLEVESTHEYQSGSGVDDVSRFGSSDCLPMDECDSWKFRAKISIDLLQQLYKEL